MLRVNRYVWDGKVLLAVLDHTNGLVMSFMRGSDLSGSIQGAGGVGGVLAVKVGSAVPSGPLRDSTHFVSYDGNGNVVALTDAATGESTAVYEYGPFGEVLRATGPMAQIMPLRFSTMYADDVTGDVKYLFRDLRVQEGRWTSRDPIEERGGKNLYIYIQNFPCGCIDSLGLEPVGRTYQNIGFKDLFGLVGHAAMDLYDKSYGYGPADGETNYLRCKGSTSDWDSGTTPRPRTVIDLYVSGWGRFRDPVGGKCCSASKARILQCADHFAKTWHGTIYSAINHHCGHYVLTIERSCCLRRGLSARIEL